MQLFIKLEQKEIWSKNFEVYEKCNYYYHFI